MNYNQMPTYQPQPTMIDGVETEYIKYYVGESHDSYIKKFIDMRSKNSYASFNFLVFLFTLFFGPAIGSLWFFYRKMYKPAIIFLSVGIASLLGTFIIVAINIESITDTFNQLADAINNLYKYEFTGDGSTLWLLVVVPVIMLGLNIACAFVMAIMANGLYLKDITKKINLEKQKPEPISQPALAKLGGTSFMWVLVLVSYVIVSIAISVTVSYKLIESTTRLFEASTNYYSINDTYYFEDFYPEYFDIDGSNESSSIPETYD